MARSSVIGDTARSAARRPLLRASDQKRQLRGTHFAVLELSPMQLTKVNAFAPSGAPAAVRWLTPKQRAALEAVE